MTAPAPFQRRRTRQIAANGWVPRRRPVRGALPLSGPSAEVSAAERYSDRPLPLTTRLVGMTATLLVCLAFLGIGLLRWADTPHPKILTSTLTLIETAPPRAPPAPPSEQSPEPERTARDVPPEPPASAATSALPIPSLIQTTVLPAVGQPRLGESSAPVPAISVGDDLPSTRASRPGTPPAPPAPKVSDERPQWERLVLAALHRAKRYPNAAERNRQEGTSWLRFTIDRRGHVRSVVLERPSGVAALDREALALPTRAEPLPRPPKSVTGNRVELIVPIEFALP